MMDFRVIPGRMAPFVSGVQILLPFTTWKGKCEVQIKIKLGYLNMLLFSSILICLLFILCHDNNLFGNMKVMLLVYLHNKHIACRNLFYVFSSCWVQEQDIRESISFRCSCCSINLQCDIHSQRRAKFI